MTASIRAADRGPSKDEPSKYAPKKARQPEPAPAIVPSRQNGEAAPGHTPPKHTPPEHTPHTPPESSSAEPPWRRSRPRNTGGGTPFIGDVAIAELRTKLALAPDRLPEPPAASSTGSKLVWGGRITGVAVVVAVGFLGYRWGSSPNTRFQLLPHAPSHRTLPMPDRAGAAPETGGLTIMNAVPAVYPPPGKPNPPGSGRTFRQLTVSAVPAQQTDEAVRLAVSAADAGANAAVVISGLAPGSTLSAGREMAPNTWRISVEDLPGVFVTPPRSFVGSMDLTVELRLGDNSVADRKGLQLEWLGRGIAARPLPRQHDAGEIAQMVKKGAELMANGDVAAARLMYQRAAEAGEATAAFALAESYDPLVPGKGGIPPDVGLAQTWYAKAKELGSTQASERLDRLTRWDGQ